MKEIKTGVTKTYSVPASVTKLTITHEWGDVVVDNATVTPLGTYSFAPDSIGVYKFTWSVGSTFYRDDFYQSYVPIIVASDFFNENDELGDFEDDFNKVERIIRYTIQNYTGQRFGPYVNKSMDIQGDGGDSLLLPVRMVSLTSVLNSYGDELIDMCEVSPNEPTILQRSPRFTGGHIYEIKRDVMWNSFQLFNDRTTFTITGNWGWEYVPSEVTEAAALLMAQGLGDDDIQEMRNRGVFRSELGDFKIFLNQDQWGTTGNNRADNMLAGYVNWGIGLA